jgi:hypothetical protein
MMAMKALQRGFAYTAAKIRSRFRTASLGVYAGPTYAL